MNEPKTRRPRPPRPVESFGPELMSALMRGALEGGLTLSLPWRDAVRFRLRVHQLREAMRMAKHDKYPLVARVRVSINVPPNVELVPQGSNYIPRDRSTLCEVVLRPNDSEFSSALHQAGIDVNRELSSPSPSTSPVAEPSPSLDTIEDILKGL